MTTQNINYNLTTQNNGYNLISYYLNNNNECETVIYNSNTLQNNKDKDKDKDNIVDHLRAKRITAYTSFNHTKAYDEIISSYDKCVYIDNNDLVYKSKINDKPVNRNKYFMLINIDGNDNPRKNKIGFNRDEINDINNNINLETKIIGQGKRILNTFYIINTFIGDISKNLLNIIELIRGNNNIIKQIKFPLNYEKYGIIQQIIYIIAEKQIYGNMKGYDDNVETISKKIINYIKNNTIYNLSNIKLNIGDSKVNTTNNFKEIFNYNTTDREYKLNDERKNDLIKFFKKMIVQLLDDDVDYKILIYNSKINNQIGRSRNNGLLITYTLAQNKYIYGDYIKVLDNSGYISYYGNLLDQNSKINNFENKITEKDNLRVKQEFGQQRTFNYVKYDGKNIIKEKTIENMAYPLKMSYNLHIYKKEFFIKNITNLLCFDADLAEDSGNGRVLKLSDNTYDNETYYTIYGKMNTHYMPPIIQIFKHKNNYILAALEDEETKKWVDISKYKKIINEIIYKYYIILCIYNDNSKIYIYLNNENQSCSDKTLYKLFTESKEKNIAECFKLKDGILTIDNDKIKYNNTDYKVDIYLGYYIGDDKKIYDN